MHRRSRLSPQGKKSYTMLTITGKRSRQTKQLRLRKNNSVPSIDIYLTVDRIGRRCRLLRWVGWWGEMLITRIGARAVIRGNLQNWNSRLY